VRSWSRTGSRRAGRGTRAVAVFRHHRERRVITARGAGEVDPAVGPEVGDRRGENRRLALGPLERGQQNGDQDCDDRNDDEQLDYGKRGAERSGRPGPPATVTGWPSSHQVTMAWT